MTITDAELAEVLAALGRPVVPDGMAVGDTVTVAGVELEMIREYPLPVVSTPDLATYADRAAIAAELAGDTPMGCPVCRLPLDHRHEPHGVDGLPVDDLADLLPAGARASGSPVPVPPPSTVMELRNILADFDANTARSRQVEIGPSEIAVPCDRRLGYALRNMPKHPDGRLPWAALVGTAVHALIAEALKAENARLGRERWLIEQRVYADPDLAGNCDAYDTDHDLVVDWKVPLPTTLKRNRGAGPTAQYVGQLQTYGRGWERAGRTPRWVRIAYLSRSNDFDESHEWTAPYDPAAAAAVLGRRDALRKLLDVLDVTGQPTRWADVPEVTDRLCTYCPYFRMGGPADDTGCPGDVAYRVRNAEKTSRGIIAPAITKESQT